MKSFSGRISKELLCYEELTLKNKKFDTDLLHVGVNDLLNYETEDSSQNLMSNLKQIGLKCKSTGATRILISGIVVNSKLISAYISSRNQHISNMCQNISIFFIGNNNILTSSLFCNGLNLLEIQKCVLAKNFIDS